MRIIYYSLLFLLFFVTGCGSLKEKKNRISENREYLKDYFLCSCITNGFRSIHIEDYDSSRMGYIDTTRYNLKAYLEIDSIAKINSDAIEPSPITDYNNRKNIIMRSIDRYRGTDEYNRKTTNKFIRENVNKIISSMDKYMIKE